MIYLGVNVENNNKIKQFEYLIYKLLDWHFKETGIQDHGFDKLKVFKLLFFVTVVNSTRNDKSLLKYFNSFYAYPYGPVEQEIYLNLHELVYYKFEKNQLIPIKTIDNEFLNQVDSNFKEILEKSLNKIRQINSKLVLYNPFKLVDISHQWSSWIYYYQKSKSNRSPELIPEFSLMTDNDITINNPHLINKRYFI